MALTRVLGATAVAATLPTTVGGTGATTFSPGKVLQVVYGNTGTAVANATTSYIDTGLTATITPSATTSKILILVTQSIGKSNNNTFQDLNLLRDTTSLFDPWANDVLYTATVQHLYVHAAFNYLDSPSSTSALVYKTQFKSYNTDQVNVQAADGSQSSMTLMEIGV